MYCTALRQTSVSGTFHSLLKYSQSKDTSNLRTTARVLSTKALMPKSAILALPAVLNRMLAGFMSRCTCSAGLCLVIYMVYTEKPQVGGCHTQSTMRWER